LKTAKKNAAIIAKKIKDYKKAKKPVGFCSLSKLSTVLSIEPYESSFFNPVC
jgi:hypothetical protein